MSEVDDIELEVSRIVEEAREYEREADKLEKPFPKETVRLREENARLKIKILQLKKQLKLKSDLLMRRAIIKKKMHQAKDTRKDEVQCTWCRKYVSRGKLKHLNNLGNFCEECLSRREEDINARR